MKYSIIYISQTDRQIDRYNIIYVHINNKLKEEIRKNLPVDQLILKEKSELSINKKGVD